MKLKQIIMLLIVATLVPSCALTEFEKAQDLTIGAGGYYGARTLGADTGVAAAAGLLSYGASRVGNKRRNELEARKVEEAREQGKQTVMLDTYHKLNNLQRLGNQGTENHEVVIPVRGYTTNDGVIMEPHDRVILTR